MQLELFNSIFTNSSTNMTISQMALSLATSLGLGLILAFVYRYKTMYTKEFVITLTLLPTLISIIIILVNGNLGTSVAVAGAFSLIRFRSAAGSSKELLAVFLATAIGLATGMGYLLLAISFTLLLGAIIMVMEHSFLVKTNAKSRYAILTVAKEFDAEQFFKDHSGPVFQKTELASIHYKKKKEVLVLEYLLEVDKGVSDKKLVDTLLSAEPIDLVLHQQIPKKKRL